MPIKPDISTRAPSGQGPRKCLKCGRLFPSAGIHQRICRACKRRRGLDEPDPEDRLDSEASRVRREQGLRRLMGLPLRRHGLTRFLVGFGHRFDRCQWIEGKPGPDDACKCGQATRVGAPYCDSHQARARLRPEPKAESPRRRAAA